ncbi:ATP-binding protein [Streptomyces sp. NPDC005551]|uniref:ATP-binding protein n=1 Tax=unclassified Streptomyces TaxID=2593676 RepID=UPI0033C078C4
MATDRHDADAELLTAISLEQTWCFDGAAADVADARAGADGFLRQLTHMHPSATPDAYDDALLVVTELASNAVAFAPGPFTLTLQALMTGSLHISLADANPIAPAARPADFTGQGGMGWHLVNTVADEVIVVTGGGGKTVHTFLPW